MNKFFIPDFFLDIKDIPGVEILESEDGIETRLNGEIHSIEDRPAVIYSNGTMIWKSHGIIHRDGDKAAVISLDGDLFFYKDGLLGRENKCLPSLYTGRGDLFFYKNGVLNDFYFDSQQQNAIHFADDTEYSADSEFARNYTIHAGPEYYLNVVINKKYIEIDYVDEQKYKKITFPDRTEWHYAGQLHSLNSRPSIIYNNGSMQWHIKGKLGRRYDKPSCIDVNGILSWYHKGVYSRLNTLPAVVRSSIDMDYYVDGKHHRTDSYPSEIVYGYMAWHTKGRRVKRVGW
jgi:hypothetical protein